MKICHLITNYFDLNSDTLPAGMYLSGLTVD